MEATVELLIGPTAILLCFREKGGPRKGRKIRDWRVSGAVRTHPTSTDCHLIWVQSTVLPLNITTVT